jgi:hypothetical protein
MSARAKADFELRQIRCASAFVSAILAACLDASSASASASFFMKSPAVGSSVDADRYGLLPTEKVSHQARSSIYINEPSGKTEPIEKQVGKDDLNLHQSTTALVMIGRMATR